ncbi:hypothetical protein KM043_018055 [Ampulex compressa]|nr:hypothetical protein KM043_018055 [Ampulex compressa]
MSGGEVLEVGPGPGALTRSILRQSPKRLIVVEKDKRFKPTLDMLAEAFESYGGRMEIMYDDITRLNLNNVFSENEKQDWNQKNPNIHLIGNLPFNVSTPLIIQWLQALSERTGPWAYGKVKMTLTFQKEVAERLVAQEKDAQRCRLSIMAQAWTYPVLRFIIPGAAFLPKPDVDVGVVTFFPLTNPRTSHDFKLFEKISRHMFSFRQKHSIRCIETLFPLYCRDELALMMYKLTDLDPTMKPTSFTVEDIDKLTTAYKYLVEKHPEIAKYNYRASRKVLSMSETKDIEVTDSILQIDEPENNISVV